MKESLEDFVRRNRAAFDDRSPREGLWDRIETALAFRGWWHSVSLWRAAAVLFLGMSALLYFAPGRPGDQASSIRSEFDALESFYEGQITEKVMLISSMESSGSSNDYTVDLQRLDAMYDVLRAEMARRPSAEVRDALILNLLVKIDLLNRRIYDLDESQPVTTREI
jgi:hypothetical protein